MPETSRKRSGELVRGVFQILMQQPEGLAAKDVLARLETVVPPTPFELSSYPRQPNVRRFERIVRFSTIAAVKAGWLVKNKGAWSLTDEGRAAFKKFTNPEEFTREAGRLYKKWKADQPADEADEAEEEAGQAAATLEEAEEAAWSEIEEFLETMSPYDFQELVAGLLRGMGYFVDWISSPGPDRGIDIVAHIDPLGVKGHESRLRSSAGLIRLRWTGFADSWRCSAIRTWDSSCAPEGLPEMQRMKRDGRRNDASCFST